MGGSKKKGKEISESPVYSDTAKKMMERMGYTSGGGLGKFSQGIKEPLKGFKAREKEDKPGIGYITLPEPEPEPEDNDRLNLLSPPANHEGQASEGQLFFAKAAKTWKPKAKASKGDILLEEAAKAWEDYISTVPGRDFKKKDEDKKPEEEKKNTVAKSSYAEDVLYRNHSLIWGSYWKDGKWGYGCCKSLVKECFCQPPRDDLEFPVFTFSHEFKHEIKKISNTQKNKRRRSGGRKKEVVAASCCCCARFSPDGEYIASCLEGSIKVWHWILKKVVNSLGDDDRFSCVEFSPDSQMIASGSEDGKIKVYGTRCGTCVNTLEAAPLKAVTSLTFSPDGKLLLSSSLDHKSRIIDLESSRFFKEFCGDRAIFSKDGSCIVTAFNDDCTIKVWDLVTSNCLKTIDTRPSIRGRKALVNAIHIFPKASDQLVVCNKTSSICIMTLQGEFVKIFKSKDQGSAFVASCVSPKGDFIYGVGEDNMVYCFAYESGRLEHRFEVKGVCGVTHHPHRNVVATYSKDTTMRLWNDGSSRR